MVNYKPNPTYYRITFNNSPYAALTGTQAGGLDCISPLDYNSQVRITGNAAFPVTMNAGDHFYINGNKIVFDAADNTIDEIIVKINLHSVVTNVTATKAVSTSYITLINSPNNESISITLSSGSVGADALATLGFSAGVYKTYPNVVGSAIGTVANGNKILINGAEVTMSGGSQSAIVNSINSASNSTGVIAYSAAGKIQIGSLNGQPWTTATGTIDPTEIGFPPGTYSGTPATLAQSEAKTRANFRWLMVQAALEEFSTPFLWDDILTTGNFDGTSVPTTISWTVGYEHPDQITTIARADEPNPGTELKGTDAIKRAVARGMIATYTANAKLWDPTIVVRNYHAIRPNSIRINQMTADGVDTVANITSVEDNVIVDMITYE